MTIGVEDLDPEDFPLASRIGQRWETDKQLIMVEVANTDWSAYESVTEGLAEILSRMTGAMYQSLGKSIIEVAMGVDHLMLRGDASADDPPTSSGE